MKKITLMLFALVAFCWQSNAQLNEGFDTVGLPAGWTETIESGEDNDWAFGATQNQNSTVAPRTGAGMAYYYEGSYATEINRLETPSQDLTSFTVPVLTFYYTQVAWGADQDELRVYYKTSATGPLVLLTEFTSNVEDWTVVNLSLPEPSADYYVVFEGTSGYGRGITLDDVSIDEAPSCFAPTELTASVTSVATAELSWTAGSTETSWDIEVVDITAGGTVTGTATASGVNNPYTVSGLTDGNDYEFYVAAVCGVNDISSWVGPFAWSQNVPPVNDNPAGAIPITPSAEGTGCTADTFTLTFSTDFTSDSGLQGGCSTSGLDQFFTWTATTEGLTFSSGTGSPGIVVWDATTLTEVSCLNTFATDALLSGWLIGQDLIIQIYDFEGSISDVTFCLEEYAFPTAPDCPTNPTPIDGATDVTGGDITLTWDAPVSGPTPTSYDLYSGAMSDGSDFTLVGNFTTNSADVTLDYDATVYYEVRSKNGASESAMCSIWSFTTGSAPLPPVNDDIANATTISIGEMICDGNTNNGTNISATDSGEGAGTCFFGGAGSDVWYTFTLPSDDIVTVSTDYTGGTLTDTQIAIFSGTSGALVQEGCDQDSGSTTLSNGSDYNSIIEDLDLTAGTYYVQVSGYNGQVGTFCLSLDAQSLSVDTVQNESAFTYYPNPVKNTLSLNAQKTIEQVSMYNMLGQEVLRATPNTVDSDLDMSNLATGAYFVKVTIANVTETIRVIKQ